MSAAAEKPHFKVIAGRPVNVERRESPVESARRRFGRPFAHESGSEWKRGVGLHDEPILACWLARRLQGRQK